MTSVDVMVIIGEILLPLISFVVGLWIGKRLVNWS